MGRTKNVVSKSTRINLDIESKEELIEYLESNPETEPVFLEELWDRSIILAERDKKNGKKKIEITTTNGNGEVVTKGKCGGYWSDSPIEWYLHCRNLNQWTKKSNIIKEEREAEPLDDYAQKILSSSFDNEDEDEEYSDEVTSWINLFKLNEKKFLKKRYAHYYENYEINEGADKTTLKRVLSLEIALHRLDIKRAVGSNINITEEQKLGVELRYYFESLKWTKKQRNARDEMAQNKFTVWIQEASKDEHFENKKREYDKDEIDFLLDTYLESAREMLS